MSFIQKLKDPNFVLKGCHIAWQKWPHEITSAVYDRVWRDFLRSGDNKPDWHVRLGIAYLMLLDWNMVLFVNKPELMQQLREDITEAYEDTKSDLQVLEGLHLGSGCFELYRDKIESVYYTWSYRASIGMTGASKALHFLIPWLFVPWDKGISEFYHSACRHPTHRIGGYACYGYFMETCNDIASALLSKNGSIIYLHPAYKARGDIRTIPKMIDECNFAWIQKGERW